MYVVDAFFQFIKLANSLNTEFKKDDKLLFIREIMIRSFGQIQIRFILIVRFISKKLEPGSVLFFKVANQEPDPKSLKICIHRTFFSQFRHKKNLNSLI